MRSAPNAAVLLLASASLAAGCLSPAPRPTAHTPAADARARVNYLQSRGRTISQDQIRLIEQMPYRSDGIDIPGVLKVGVREPIVPFGERRSVLELYRGLESKGTPQSGSPSNGEEESIDPQR